MNQTNQLRGESQHEYRRKRQRYKSVCITALVWDRSTKKHC